MIQKSKDNLFKGLLHASILELKGNKSFFYVKQYTNKDYYYLFIEIDTVTHNHVITGVTKEAFNSFDEVSYHYKINDFDINFFTK